MTGKTDNKSESRRKLPDSALWLLIVLNALLFLLFLVIAAYTFYAAIFSDRAVDSPAFQSGLLANLMIALVVFGGRLRKRKIKHAKPVAAAVAA